MINFIGLVEALSVLVYSGLVYWIQVSLVEVDEEHNVVAETSKTVGGGHGDDESKDVIDESVKSLKKR